jgi:hypothetical protein
MLLKTKGKIMGSFFKTGFDSYEKELMDEGNKYQQGENLYAFHLKVNESKEIIFLDDTGFRFQEHSFFNQISKKSENYTCKMDIEGDCILCKLKAPTLITVATIKDLAGYVDKTGERKGQGGRKLFKIKRTAGKMLNDLRKDAVDKKASEMWEKQRSVCEQKGLRTVEEVRDAIWKSGNILKNYLIRAARYGAKSENCGDNFNLVRWVKQDQLKSDDVPFDYEKVFAPKPDDVILYELRNLYGMNVPPEYVQILGAGTSPQGNVNQSSTREEAPSFAPDDIPF